MTVRVLYGELSRDKHHIFFVGKFFLTQTSTLKPEWNQLVEIMGRFQYFDHWTDEQRQDCQTRAKVREFDPGQTIFVEGRSPVNYAHFVLSGRCMVVQCLKMIKVRFGYFVASTQPTCTQGRKSKTFL